MTNGPAPDTAMATGNDEGEAGARGVDDRPLDAADDGLAPPFQEPPAGAPAG